MSQPALFIRKEKADKFGQTLMARRKNVSAFSVKPHTFRNGDKGYTVSLNVLGKSVFVTDNDVEKEFV